jgi:hypothetical protein
MLAYCSPRLLAPAEEGHGLPVVVAYTRAPALASARASRRVLGLVHVTHMKLANESFHD